MKTSFIMLVLAGVSACSIAADMPKSADQAHIQGIWVAQSGSNNGQKEDVAGCQYIFSGDRFTIRSVVGIEEHFSFKLDTTSIPKSFVLQPERTITNATYCSVAYELNGYTLRVAIACPGSHPTSISDTNNQELIVLKRKSP